MAHAAHPDEGAGITFHGALAESWNRRHERRGFQKRLGFTRQLLSNAVRAGERWLDAGCGAGILTLELSRLGATGLAVDGSQSMVDAAIRAVGPLSTAFAVRRVASITSMDVAPGTFDGVLCSSVIEYVDSADRALAEFNRVLKPGGTLLLSAPNRHSSIRRAQKCVRTIGGLVSLDPFPYLTVSVHSFTKTELLQRVRCAGFRPRTVEMFDPLLPGPLTRILPASLYFLVAEKTFE